MKTDIRSVVRAYLHDTRNNMDKLSTMAAF